MKSEYRADLERIGDELEGIARTDWKNPKNQFKVTEEESELFQIAWELKQIARRGTASEGK